MNLKIKKVFVLCLLSFSFCFSQVQNYQVREIKFITEDGFNIAASLGVNKTTGAKSSAIIFIHQGGSDRNEWSDLFEEFLKQNFTVLAYDVRGHGISDKVDDIYALFNDPNQSPNDIKAAIKYLIKNKLADSSRIAIIGASIGANLACVGVSKFNIKTAVAISGKTSAVKNLNGSTKLKLHSIFFISSEGDQDGMRAKWAKELYESTEEPRKLEIVKNSSVHGVSIFKDDPSLPGKILQWIRDTL